MTREEAIEYLVGMDIESLADGLNEAVTMAIEALSADAVDVVRCKNCRHSRVYQTDSKGTMHTNCVAFVMPRTVTDDDYCSWGERKEE